MTNSSDTGSCPPELERVPCGLCGGPRYRRYARKFDLDLVKCRDCGLVYANPRLVEAEVLKRYSPDYFYGEYLPTFNAGPASFDMELIRKHYALFLRILSRSRAPGRRLLDVGCGAGFFLKAAQEAGWDAEGVEVSAAAAAYGNEVLGVKVRNAKLERCVLPPGTFDVITLLDTIEHLPHPLASLTEVRRLLKRNGLLLLNTPDLRSLSRLFLGQAWAVLSPAEHLYNFTAGTLGRLITKAGFDVVAVENLLTLNPEYTHKPNGFRAKQWRSLHERFSEKGRAWAKEKSDRFESAAVPEMPAVAAAGDRRPGLVGRLKAVAIGKAKGALRGDMLVALAVSRDP